MDPLSLVNRSREFGLRGERAAHRIGQPLGPLLRVVSLIERKHDQEF